MAEQALADQTVDEIVRRLEDTPPRNGSDDQWPGLSGHAAGHRRLVDLTRRLFGLFSRADVDRAAIDRSGRAWADVAYDRAHAAADLGVTWSFSAEAAWAPLGALLVERVRESADGQWASGVRRLALTRVFLEQCERRLTGLVLAMAWQRERHVRQRRGDLAAYRELAGPWLVRAAAPAVAESASPSFGPRESPAPRPDVAGTRTPVIEDEDEGAALGFRLTRMEDRVARALRERARDRRELVPRWQSAVTSILLVLAAAGLPALSLLAPGPILAAGALAASLVAGVLLHLAVYLVRRRGARAAENDLLRFLSLSYAHRCHRLEDRFRVVALGPLRWWAQRTLHALEEADGFLHAVRLELRAEQRRIERSLFETPSGQLDMLVAGGRRLAPSGVRAPGQVTLDELLEVVRALSGPDGLSDAFLATVPSGTELLEMDDAELRDRLLGFIGERLRRAVPADAPAEVVEALRDPGMQHRLAREVESALIPLAGALRARELYLYGAPDLADVGGLPAVLPLPGRARDWWLFASVLAVDAGSTLDAAALDRLFPARTGGGGARDAATTA
jgi:hypothetical protein